jgi:Immunoglobulin V-set domain
VCSILVSTPENIAVVVGSSATFTCKTNSTAIHSSSTVWDFITDLSQQSGIRVFTGTQVSKKFSEDYQVAVNATHVGSVLTISGVKLNNSGYFKCQDIDCDIEWSSAELIVLCKTSDVYNYTVSSS